jgi:hypothetical protein
MSSHGDGWAALHKNLVKASTRWAQISCMPSFEGANPHVSAISVWRSGSATLWLQDLGNHFMRDWRVGVLLPPGNWAIDQAACLLSASCRFVGVPLCLRNSGAGRCVHSQGAHLLLPSAHPPFVQKITLFWRHANRQTPICSKLAPLVRCTIALNGVMGIPSPAVQVSAW